VRNNKGREREPRIREGETKGQRRGGVGWKNDRRPTTHTQHKAYIHKRVGIKKRESPKGAGKRQNTMGGLQHSTMLGKKSRNYEGSSQEESQEEIGIEIPTTRTDVSARTRQGGDRRLRALRNEKS